MTYWGATGYGDEFKLMVSACLKRRGFQNHSDRRLCKTLFSAEEATNVNVDLPSLVFCKVDEESPDLQRALCVKTEWIYFFICFLLLAFGNKNSSLRHVNWILLFSVVLTFFSFDATSPSGPGPPHSRDF
jgi:hypothetical protein